MTLTLEQIGLLVSLCVAAGTPIVTIAWHMYSVGIKIAKLETRVDTLWEFLMRRGAVEATKKGLAKANSPFTVLPHAKTPFAKMKDELIAFYKALPKPINDLQLMFELEKSFGAKITKEICLPLGFTSGECMLVAAAVAKEQDVIEISQTAPAGTTTLTTPPTPSVKPAQ